MNFYTTCDHKIIRENVFINDDYKTIPIPRGISSRVFELWINGYQIEKDNTVNSWQIDVNEKYPYSIRHKVVFKNKRKSLDDFYEITYYVEGKYCPKCLGLRVLNDESYSRLGLVNTVENEDKLLQEIKKGLTTQLGSNAFHTWIGTEIHKLIGAKVYNIGMIRSKIVQEVSAYIERYTDVQTQQSQFQSITPRETFYSLISVDAGPENPDDPTYWYLEVTFSNATGDEMLYEKKLEIPGPKTLF